MFGCLGTVVAAMLYCFPCNDARGSLGPQWCEEGGHDGLYQASA